MTNQEYFSPGYDYKGRFISYWHQIQEVRKYLPKGQSCLEVGPGNYFLTNYLRAHGYTITTLDIDNKGQPDLVGSVTNIQTADNAFDAALCFEVLEHIPFDQFTIALNELARVARRYVIFSVPDVRYFIEGEFRLLSSRQEYRFLLSFPRLHKKDVPPYTPGGHFWEIGRKNYPVQKVINSIPSSLKLLHNYRVPGNAVHHMFILEKQN